MVANIAQATREGNLASKLKTYTAPSVLVLDDVALLPTDRAAASACCQVVNLRYEKQHYLVSTDGTHFGHPDDETLAIIATARLHLPPTICFNWPSERNERWAARAARSEGAFAVQLPQSPNEGIRLELVSRHA